MSHGHCYTAVLASWYVMLRWTETVTANRERVPWLISDEAHETGRDSRRASALAPVISKCRPSHWILGGCWNLLEIGLITKMRWAFLVAMEVVNFRKHEYAHACSCPHTDSTWGYTGVIWQKINQSHEMKFSLKTMSVQLVEVQKVWKV